MTEAPRSRARRLVEVLLALFALGMAALLAGVTWLGWDYYRLPVAARAGQPLDDVLAPGAGGGLLLGVWGTLLMVAMLSYTVRKRFAHVTWLGPVPLWLRFHVICGVTGPLFILLHTGVRFAPVGIIAVGFWCMVLVALSGVFGRYVYSFLPRLANGRAMAWSEAMTALADLRADLVSRTLDARGSAVGDAVALVRDMDTEARSLVDLVRLDRDVRLRRQRIGHLLTEAGLAEDARRQAFHAIDAQLSLKRSLEASRVAHRMFRYWHLFHRPLASAMYTIVALHVATALIVGGSLARLLAFLGW